MKHRQAAETLVDAFALACRVHAGDVRKGTSIPYIAHLLGVCSLVLADGGDEDEAIAALLHDTLEDHGDLISASELEHRFGARVRAIVEACTDTPAGFTDGEKPAWRQRKEAYIEHVRHAHPETLRVSLADKLHNARAIVADVHSVGDGVWSRFKAGKDGQKWYYRSLVGAFRESGVRGPMLNELSQVVDDLERL